MTTNNESPFVCDLNAIEPADRDRHIATVIEVFRAVQTVRELPNGYAFRLPNDTSLLIKGSEFIANERLCCPFFGFAVVAEPQDGPLWLHLTGPEGVKPFIQAEIGEALNDEAAKAAGFR
jgi:hypothetical protein